MSYLHFRRMYIKIMHRAYQVQSAGAGGLSVGCGCNILLEPSSFKLNVLLESSLIVRELFEDSSN